MSNDELSPIFLVLEKIEYIAEQFNRLKEKNLHLWQEFETEDLKGLYDVRTYIAHNYEGVNLSIIEWIIRYGLGSVKDQCKKVIYKYEND